MSAQIVALFGTPSPPPDTSGIETERQYAAQFLRNALAALADDEVDKALSLTGVAARMLERLADCGMTEAEERQELARRARRIERAVRGAETRARNRRLQEAALAANGLRLVAGGVEPLTD